MGVLAFVVFPVLAPFRAVCGPFVWNPCGIPGAFCRGFPENLNPDQSEPFPENPGVGMAGLVLFHPSHICQIGATDQGHFRAIKVSGAPVVSQPRLVSSSNRHPLTTARLLNRKVSPANPILDLQSHTPSLSLNPSLGETRPQFQPKTAVSNSRANNFTKLLPRTTIATWIDGIHP